MNSQTLANIDSTNFFIVSEIEQNGIVNEGDSVFYSEDAEIKKGDIVIAQLNDGRNLIRKYDKLDETTIILSCDNQEIAPEVITKNKLLKMHKAVYLGRAL